MSYVNTTLSRDLPGFRALSYWRSNTHAALNRATQTDRDMPFSFAAVVVVVLAHAGNPHLAVLFCEDEHDVSLEPARQLLEKAAVEVQPPVYQLRAAARGKNGRNSDATTTKRTKKRQKK